MDITSFRAGLTFWRLALAALIDGLEGDGGFT